MKKLFFIFIIYIALMQIATAQPKPQDTTSEIVWLKLRTDIGLEEIINAVFTPGDSSILVTDINHKLVEIDPATGNLKREIPNIKGAIKFSDDGQYLYTYGFEKVKYPSGELIGKFPIDGFATVYGNYNAGFDINEKAGLLIGVEYQSDHNPANWTKGIWIFDLKTFKLIDTIGFIKNYYFSNQITGDGKYFYTFSEYIPDWTKPEQVGFVHLLWDTKTFDTIRQDYQFGYIKTSPDGRWLCSIGDNLVRIFDANTFEKKYEFKQAPDSSGLLTAIDISPDSRFLATSGDCCGEISNIHIWDLNKNLLSYNYKNGNNGIGQHFLRYSYSGNYLIGYSEGGMVLYNNITTKVVDNKYPLEPILYPNPATGNVQLQIDLPYSAITTIGLYDMTGKLVKQIQSGFATQGLFELNFSVSDLPAGMYFIKITQKDFTETLKLVKEK